MLTQRSLWGLPRLHYVSISQKYRKHKFCHENVGKVKISVLTNEKCVLEYYLQVKVRLGLEVRGLWGWSCSWSLGFSRVNSETALEKRFRYFIFGSTGTRSAVINFHETLMREPDFTKVARCFKGGSSVTETKYSMWLEPARTKLKYVERYSTERRW